MPSKKLKNKQPIVYSYGRNKLMIMVIENLTEEVEKIIKSGVDINFKDNDGWTALHFAAQNFNEQIMALLLNNGADPNAQDNYGNTPLFRALFNCKGIETNIFELFKKKGANPKIKNNQGRSALDLIKDVANYDLKKYFIEYFSINHTNKK